MKHSFTILLVFQFTIFSQIYSQTILNGNFENHTATSCSPNLSNIDYSLLMADSYAFGLANEVDIQDSICSYATPNNGDWFVSLHSKPSTFYADELSLVVNPPLVAGNSYTIGYYEQANTIIDDLDSLQIGVSLDSLSFGQVVYTSQPPIDTWTYRSFTFLAPNNSQYITIKNQGLQRGWNFVDNIQIEKATGINEFSAQNLVVYPNPTENFVSVKANAIEGISLVNTLGVALFSIKCKATDNYTIDLSTVKPGIYYITIRSGDKLITQKITKI